jgi:hypothetical protein
MQICDRAGTEVCSLRWRDGELASARLRLPVGGAIVLEPGVGEHPLFGPIDRARLEDDHAAPVVFAAVRWSAPEHIPPLDRPGSLVAGAGTAILNLLARRAAQVGIPSLRYRGPYPTAALFDTLLSSFHVQGDLEQAAERFCEDVETHAVRGAMKTVAVDFEPAPHEWLFVHPRVCVQARTSIERVYIDGDAYVRDPQSVTQLREEDDALVAGLVIAGRRCCDVARIDRAASLVDGPQAIPPVDSPLVDLELPRPLVDLLAEAIRHRAPLTLRPALDRLFETTTVRFGDTGRVLGRRAPDSISVHALLGEQLDEMDAPTQIAWLLAAIEPVARRWAQQRLAVHSPSTMR